MSTIQEALRRLNTNEEVEIKKDVKVEENFESSWPVTPLPYDDVRSFIEGIGPGRFFSVGYVKELNSEIAAAYRKGAGDNPKVRIIKCSEMYGSTGVDYENKQATKDMRGATGKERSGNSYNVEVVLSNKILKTASGVELLQFFPRSLGASKVEYFISLNDGDLVPATKGQVDEYLIPSARTKAAEETAEETVSGPAVVRLKLGGIYRIGNLGSSVF